jgi:putative ABC transport system substrate-binding protein
VGLLGIGSSSDLIMPEAFTAAKQGLAETGFIEGRNFAFEYRWADYHPERLPGLAADLVRRRVAVMLTPSTAATLAAKVATDTIPIVFQVGIDPVAYGLVASFNRPGGNITGVTNLTALLAAKRLEVLHELAPAAGLLAVLANPNSPLTTFETKELEAAAGVLGVRLLIVNAAGPDEFGMAFATIAQQRAGALLVSSDALFLGRYEQLIALATRHAMPTMYTFRAAPEAGGLMSYILRPCRSSRPSRPLHRADSQGRKACRSAGATGHQGRADHQSQDGENAWHHLPDRAAGSRRQGDRVGREGK